jgi:hypothetical protein
MGVGTGSALPVPTPYTPLFPFLCRRNREKTRLTREIDLRIATKSCYFK